MNKIFKPILSLLTAAAFLSACGGGGGGSDETQDPTPPAHGDLDSTFKNSASPMPGVVKTDNGDDDTAYAVAMQSDGKIVVAGATSTEAGSDFAVIRYNIDGTLDATFGIGGIVTTDIAVDSADFAYAVAIQVDGKIVVAGATGSAGNADFAVIRYNIDGTLDTTFGKVTTNISGDDYANAVAIQDDGKIVVAGATGTIGNADFAIVRYKTDGTPDTSFDTDGVVTTNLGGDDIVKAVAIQGDDKIVVAGATEEPGGSENDFAIVRYKTDGTPDTSFGTDGVVTTNLGGDDIAWALDIDSSGNIVVAGDTYTWDPVVFSDIAVSRYKTNGEPDTGFGINGNVKTDINTFDRAYAVKIQPTHGKIVVAGEAYDLTTPSDFAVVRYWP